MLPRARELDEGLEIMMEPSSTNGIKVEAPIAPGLITEINVDSCRPLRLGEPKSIQIPKGTLALDGEKEIEFNAEDQVKITLDPLGPWSINVDKIMGMLAKNI